MSDIKLANKYRPNSFDDIVGQEITVRILKNIISSNNFSNMLFIGPAGCGKTTCAKLVASSLDGEVIEIDSASNNGAIEVRNIVSQSKFASISNKYKVVIFDEAHTLSNAAWSSLLIALEEDIKGTIFIFCTTDISRIPNTVLSRLQIFNFTPIEENKIYIRLKYICDKENIQIDDYSLKLLANISNGSLREAITNLERCVLYSDSINSNVVKQIFNIANVDDIKKVFLNKNVIESVKYIKELQNQGVDLYRFIEMSLSYFIKESINGNSVEYVEYINFIVKIMEELRYMIGNPTNTRNYIIAKLLVWKYMK